jgi:hypothetical protein
VNYKSYNSGSAARKDNLVEAFARLDRKLDSKKKRRRFAPIGCRASLQRLREIERFLSHSYGSILPDDDAGNDDLRIVVAAAKAAGKPAIDFVRKWAPWMSATDANRLCVDVNVHEAYLKADEIAAKLGVVYADRQHLHLRSIGSIDVNKAGRERLRRERYNTKRRGMAAAEKPPKPVLTPREKALIKMVSAGRNMGDLSKRAARSPLFRNLENVALQVRRIVARMVKAGHLGQRLEPRDRGGKEFYVWNEHIAQAAEGASRRAKAENAPRQTPIFIGSNRGASACVNSSEGAMEKRGGVKWDLMDGPVEPAPPSLELRRRYQPESELERMAS